MNPESFLNEALNCIKEIYEYLGNKKDSKQSSVDLQQGIVRRNGVVIPLSEYLHRLHFENHELFILKGYIILAEQLLKVEDNPFAYFSLRALCTIGFDKIDAHYANDVDGADKKAFILIDTLSDFVGMGGAKYPPQFLKLLSEERSSLDLEAKTLFEKAEEIYKNGNGIPSSLLKRIRKLMNRRLAKCKEKVQIPPMLDGKSQFDYLHISLSHLLHGNAFTLKFVFDPGFAKKAKNHIHVLLWHTCVNILYRLLPSIDDQVLKEKINSLLSSAEEVWKELLARRASLGE